MSGKPTRRHTWQFVLALGVSMLLAACAPAATTAPTTAPAATSAPAAAPTTAPAAAPTTAPAAPTAAPAASAAPTSASTGKPAAPVATAASRPNLSGELSINTWRDISADPKHTSYTLYLLLEQWKKNHPNVSIKYQPMLGNVTDLFGYITTNLRSKTLADVVMQYFPSPAQLDPDLQYDFSADLAKPNPYSANPTWKADFPLDAAALRDVTVGGKTLMVGTTFSGDLGDTAILYNQDILDKAGIKALPKTWADFINDLKLVKAAGYQAWYMPTAGNENYIFSWYVGILTDELMPNIIQACDGKAPGSVKDGLISQMEATWCIKKGVWNVKDPGVQALFTTMKDWSAYFNDGYLAPPQPGDAFIQGKLAFRSIVRINMPIIEGDKTINFKWGSFYLPPLKGTAGTPDGIVHRVGNAGAGQGQQFLFIPKTTQDHGKLDLALDLVQYVTSPKSIEYWCSIQAIPCYTPGTPIEKIFPNDTTMQDRYRGFIDPPALNNRASFMDINNAFGQANSVQEIKLFQDYLGGTTTLDQALPAYQKLLDQLADTTIRQHPEWNADKW